MQYINY